MLADNEAERKAHQSSGKLSASMLGMPLQWQVLKIMGVSQADPDEYTLRKFRRGKDVEAWLVKYLEPTETQKFVEYRDTVGYVDAMCNTALWDFRKGIMPVEVKSVANAKFKRICERLGPDQSHLLQACLYGIATGSEYFAVAYVAADDLRVQIYIERTADHVAKIDAIIDRFQAAMLKDEVPVFEPVEDWQANIKYNNYLEWSNLSAVEATAKLKALKEKQNVIA